MTAVKFSSGLVLFSASSDKWAVDVPVFALVVSGGLGAGTQLSQENLAAGNTTSSAVYIMGIALFAAYMSTGISGLKKSPGWVTKYSSLYYSDLCCWSVPSATRST